MQLPLLRLATKTRTPCIIQNTIVDQVYKLSVVFLHNFNNCMCFLQTDIRNPPVSAVIKFHYRLSFCGWLVSTFTLFNGDLRSFSRFSGALQCSPESLQQNQNYLPDPLRNVDHEWKKIKEKICRSQIQNTLLRICDAAQPLALFRLENFPSTKENCLAIINWSRIMSRC